MKYVGGLLLTCLLATPASAQTYAQNTTPIPRYGETDKDKSPGEIESERRADAAYKRALGNVPTAAKSNDPWGSVRGDSTAKAAPKAGPAKAAKPAAKSN